MSFSSESFFNRVPNFCLNFLKCLLKSPNQLIVLLFLYLKLLIFVDAKSAKSFGYTAGLANKFPAEYYCWTHGCIQTASLIENNINKKVNPCDNFYEFACGGFIGRTRIHKYKSSFSRLVHMKEKVQNEIKNALEEDIDPEEPRIDALVKNYYNACQDRKKIERIGLQPILDIIQNLGGWPVVVGDAWDDRNFDWMEIDAKLRHYGFNPKYILNLFVFNDLQNSIKNTLYISPLIPIVTSTTMRKGFRSPIVVAYLECMTDIAALFGADKKQAKIELTQMVLFEILLAEAIYGKTTTQYKNVTTIRDLKAQFPFISWSSYLNELSKPVIHLKDNDRVKVTNPYYIENLETVLKTSSKRVVANYLIWRAIAEAAPHLSRQIRKIYFKFGSKLINLDKPLPWWKTCIDQLTDKTGLTIGLSSLYISKYFNNETKAAITPVLHLLVQEFQNLLKNSSWMDEKSKNAALRKSDLMKYVIAYPNELLNYHIIDDYVKDLEITKDNHLKNRLNLNRFHFNYGLTGLKETTNKRLWVVLSDSTVINAYYYAVNNAFALLAGILQPPIFSHDWPTFAKFASIGFVIGHEMMHAYDKTNSELNEMGTLNPLLTPATRKNYDKRIKCFIDQYNEFVDEDFGMTVDGDKTLDENIADNLGLKIARLAYETWKKSHKEELKIPVIKYTTDQMFWIILVNILCNKVTDMQRVELFLADAHTPNDFRTFGLVSNSLKFAEAFNCSKNSPMNPEKKCEIW